MEETLLVWPLTLFNYQALRICVDLELKGRNLTQYTATLVLKAVTKLSVLDQRIRAEIIHILELKFREMPWKGRNG